MAKRCILGAALCTLFPLLSHAASITYTNYAAVTNIVFTPVLYDPYTVDMSATTTWDYRLKLIPSNQFTVVSVSFALSDGAIGGALWQDDFEGCGLDAASIEDSVSISGAGDYNYSYVDNTAVSCGGGAGTFTLFSNSTVVASYPPNYYVTGSPIDDGSGYVSFNAQFFVYNFLPEPGGGFAFLCGPPLRAIFELQPISSATASNLPPQTSASSQTILYGPAGPIPPSLDIPDYIYQLGGLYLTGIARQGNDINVSWHTVGGATNFIQRCTSLSSSNWTDIAGPIIVPGTASVYTNFVDIGGATNGLSQFYRIRSSN